ncbi:arylamine N-acetyltransferase [Chengkuizengella sp. SCS-71B]|uniref:arylamine N-acetyltransferase n=1 Tax=Chengkuizengella sp. SCS-71B TaxID=3115290 RepID=UPI0032C247BA
MNKQKTPDWVIQYLKKLHLTIPESPSYEFLEQFCKRHLTTIPFENVSKLLDFSDYKTNQYYVPPIEKFVENLFNDFGGTCTILNPYAQKLLSCIGYDCDLVLLGSGHTAILVKLPEFPAERLYMDFGGAAPIFRPVRFENRKNFSTYGPDEIQILPDDEQEGYYRFTRYRHGKFVNNAWIFNPDHICSDQGLNEVIKVSFKKDAFFMSKLRVDLFQIKKGRTLSLNNNKLTIRTLDLKEKEIKLSNIEEIESVIHKEFSLPRLPVRRAIVVLDELGIDIFQEK